MSIGVVKKHSYPVYFDSDGREYTSGPDAVRAERTMLMTELLGKIIGHVPSLGYIASKLVEHESEVIDVLHKTIQVEEIKEPLTK